jgi:serine/threonine-protein kinase RsbW
LNKAVTYRKEISASTQNLSQVREFVSRHAEHHGFSSEQISDVQLAVDEACTNIIKHAYNYDETKELSIELEFDNEKLNVTLVDQGIGFDVDRYEEPDLKKQIERKKRGGMGVYLIRNLMDEVNYYVKSRKNILQMKKNRN